MNNIDSIKIEKLINYANMNFIDSNDYQNLFLFLEFIDKENLTINSEEMLCLINNCGVFRNALSNAIKTQRILEISDKSCISLAIKSMKFIEQIEKGEQEVNKYDNDKLIVDDSNVLYDDALVQYLKQLPSKILSYNETIELCKNIENGDKSSFDKLIYYNLRLVVSIAKKYIELGIDLLDLIQTGNEGLIEAANRYNYRMGVRFSTYATYRIKQYIVRSIDNESRMIRVPANVSQNIAKVKKIMAIYYNKYGVYPSAKQIALESKLSLNEVDIVLAHINGVCSYNTYVKNNGDSCDEGELIDFIADDNCLESIVENKLLSREVRDVLDKITILTPREKSVILYRYGLVDGSCYNIGDIGNIFGVSKQSINQFERKALKKLLLSPKMQQLNQDRHC